MEKSRRKFAAAFIAASLLLPFLAPELAGAPLESFEQPSEWEVYKGAERGGAFSFAPAPLPRGSSSGRLAWAATRHSFLELYRKTTLALPGLEKEFNGTLTVMVSTPQPRAISGLSLRLIDVDGEVFQIKSKWEIPDAGWHPVSFRLTPENAKESWGGKKNGVVDLPARFTGFAMGFTAAATSPGEIYFDDLVVTTPGRRVETTRPLWRFDAAERWRVHANPAARLTPEAGGFVLEVPPLAKDTGMPLVEGGFDVKALGNPGAISLNAELLSGTGARFSLRLRDAMGEIHPLSAKELRPGRNTLVWRIPEDLRRPTWGQKTNGLLDAPCYAHELFFHQAPAAQTTRVRLESASVDETMPLLEAVKIEVETGNPIHVLKVGEERTLAIRLSSLANEPATLDVRGEMEDWGGRRIPLDQRVTLPKGGSAALALPRLPDTLGIWWIRAVLSDPTGGGELEARSSICRMVPAGPTPGRADGFLFSICTHTDRWAVAEQEKEVLAAALCGAKVMRTGVGWSGLQPKPDQWNWEPMDRLVKLYGDGGMELQYMLFSCPRWAAAPQWQASANWLDWDRHMPPIDAWKAYCTAMVKRYGDRIRYWEVWNEPDISFWRGTLDEYLDLLKGAHEAIKAVSPAARVMTGGFAIYDRNPSFIEAVVDRGQAWFDIFAYHRHGGFEPFRIEVDGPIAAMRKRLKPGIPIYFNETAVSSVEGGERAQAETLFKKLTFAWSRGSIGYTWYDLRNDGWDPKDYEHNYGMLTHDFHPKAVYPVYNTLATVLRGMKHARNFELGSGRYAFAWTGANEEAIATWSEPVAGPARHYLLSTDAKSAATVDLMGNRAEAAVLPGGRVVLVNTAAPAFLVLSGAKAPSALLGPLIDLGGPYVAVPGRPLKLRGAFVNPFAQAGRLKLAWALPSGWTAPAEGGALDLPGGARVPIEPDFLVPREPCRSGRETLSLRYEVGGTALSGTVSLPVDLALRIDDRRPDRSADFDLSERRSVVTLFGNDPAKGHLVWSGPNDLSAKIWLTRSADALKLRVQVGDDLHAQKEKAQEWWRGDSIQFALALPGQDGFWELCLAAPEGGTAGAVAYARPKGFADPCAALSPTAVKREGAVVYEAALPLKAFGMTQEMLKEGIRFNLIVNDNDGEGREGWIQIAPGIGQGKDPGQFPVVLFE